jgi:hypothetical protein
MSCSTRLFALRSYVTSRVRYTGKTNKREIRDEAGRDGGKDDQ